jgi:myosin heavy subunit
MDQVKKEATTALENMKAKLKELEELKLEVTELRFGLENSEARNKKLSVKVQELEKLVEEQWKDMQKLNEIYSIDHADYLELQDSYSKLEALSREYQNQIEALSMESGGSKSLELEIVNTKNELAETQQMLDREKEPFDATLKNKDGLIDQLCLEIEHLKQENVSLQSNLNSQNITIQEIENMEKENQELMSKVESLQNEQLLSERKLVEKSEEINELKQKLAILESKSSFEDVMLKNNNYLQQLFLKQEEILTNICSTQQERQFSSIIDQLSIQKEHLTIQLQSISSQFNNYQETSLKEELTSWKQTEKRLVDEIEKLQLQFENKTVDFVSSEKQFLNQQYTYQLEIQNLKHELAKLQDEIDYEGDGNFPKLAPPPPTARVNDNDKKLVSKDISIFCGL